MFDTISRRVVALPLALLVAITVHAQATEPQTFVPPAGELRVVELILEGAGHGAGPGRGGILIGKDTVIRGACRDGTLELPSRLSVRDIISTLDVTASSIRGQAVIQGQPRSSAELRCIIDAQVEDGKITGTWVQSDESAKGTVSGWMKTEAELRNENAFATKSDWPCWSGPHTSFAATRCDLELVDDFNKDARLVWRSEELVPPGNGNALNYVGLALTDRTMGGGASAIVAEGKVFVFYYQPAGDEYMKGVKDKYATVGDVDAFIQEEAKKQNLPASPFMSEKFLVKADDVVLCMDAVTGKTAWKTTFPGNSLNQPSHKGGVVNNTPCVGDDKVFARGPGGTLYALEIATGKPLWQLPNMSAEGVFPWTGKRNQCSAPVFIGGTLVVPDNGSTLYGISPADGKELWKLPGKSHPLQVPAKWVHQGQEYVVSMTAGQTNKEQGSLLQAVCLEARSGKVLWEIDLPPNPTKGVSVFGDMMYVTAFGPKANAAGTITAYRLSLQKPEQVWQSPATHAAVDAPPACNGRYVVVGGPGESHLYDAATGKDLATYKGGGPANEGYAAFVEDRVVLSLDGSHGHSEMVVLGATPETFSNPLGTWHQPHPNTTSYHNKFMTFPMVEGRIFMRGYDGVYCYDLRKK